MFFDEIASSYDGWYETPLGSFADEVEIALAFGLFEVRPGDLILDAGCGTGNFSLKLARKGARVVGVDISPDMLALAREKAAREGPAPHPDGDRSIIQAYPFTLPGVGRGGPTGSRAKGSLPFAKGRPERAPNVAQESPPFPKGGQGGFAVFAQMDIYNLSLPPDHFDGVVTMAAFEFIHEPQRAFAELMRVLKPGGAEERMSRTGAKGGFIAALWYKPR